jgi:NADPH:quinone reductase-like Zn-dependent oxidoreductase
MKAIVQRAYGPPAEVLEYCDIAVPPVAAGEVLVQVRASALAGGDLAVVRGEPYLARLASGLRTPRHRIPGRDVAGRVEAVGSDVTAFQPGDDVVGWCDGSFCEYVAVAESALVRMPTNLTYEQAAAVPVSGVTALQAVRDAGRVRPGHDVLVIGASGGVGTFAVQIAKALGAVVTGVCGTVDVDLVRSIGADRTVDYVHEDAVQHPERFDVIVDLVGNRSLPDLRRALRPDGTLVLVGASGGRWLNGAQRFVLAMLVSPPVGRRLRPLVHRERRRDLATLNALIEAGHVTPVVSAHYPLAEVAAAIRHFAPGHARGKVAITV